VGNDVNNNKIFDEREFLLTPKNMNNLTGLISGSAQVEVPITDEIYTYNTVYYEEHPTQRAGMYQPMIIYDLKSIENFHLQTVLGNKYFFIQDRIVNHTYSQADYEVLKNIDNQTMLYIMAKYDFEYVDLIAELKSDYSYSKNNPSYYDIMPILTLQKSMDLGKYFNVTPRYKSLFMWIDNGLGGTDSQTNFFMNSFKKYENYNIFILETTINYFGFKWMNGYEITDYNFTANDGYILENKNSYFRDSFLSRLEFKGKYIGRPQGVSITYSYTQVRERRKSIQVYSSLYLELYLGF
jgi:hypothetical protein